MIIFYILCFFFLFLFFIYNFFSRKVELLFYENKKGCLKTPEDYRVVYETVCFNSTDGVELKGWFVPSKTESDTTVIITHKDGENKSDVLDLTIDLYERFNLFYFDFRGCGESKGSFFSYGVYEIKDIEGALNFLRSFREDYSRNIIIFASSTIFLAVLRIIKDEDLKAIFRDPADDIYEYLKEKAKREFNLFILPKYFIKRFLEMELPKIDISLVPKNKTLIFSNKPFYDFNVINYKDDRELKLKLKEINF